MPDRFYCYSHANNSDSSDKIKDLLNVFSETHLSALLGIKRFALHRREQPIPVVRLAHVLHRLAFPTGAPLSIFDLLTCGKYERGDPQERPATVDDWVI